MHFAVLHPYIVISKCYVVLPLSVRTMCISAAITVRSAPPHTDAIGGASAWPDLSYNVYG